MKDESGRHNAQADLSSVQKAREIETSLRSSRMSTQPIKPSSPANIGPKTNPAPSRIGRSMTRAGPALEVRGTRLAAATRATQRISSPTDVGRGWPPRIGRQSENDQNAREEAPTQKAKPKGLNAHRARATRPLRSGGDGHGPSLPSPALGEGSTESLRSSTEAPPTEARVTSSLEMRGDTMAA